VVLVEIEVLRANRTHPLTSQSGAANPAPPLERSATAYGRSTSHPGPAETRQERFSYTVSQSAGALASGKTGP
jgi:hypothetical protein